MTRTKLFRRAAATLLAACMMFSLSAPALAEGADAALGGADDTVTVNGTVLSAAEPTLSIGNASITYDPVQHTVTNSGMVVDDLTVTVGAGAGDVDVILNAPEGALAVWGALTVEGARDVALTGSVGGPLIIQECTGAVTLKNENGCVVKGDLYIGDESAVYPASIEVVGNSTDSAITGSALLNSTGDIIIINESGRAVGQDTTGHLIVDHAKNVTVTGSSTEAIIAETDASSYSRITCSGEVELYNKQGGPAVKQVSYINSDNKTNCLGLIGKTPEDAEPMGAIPEGASYIRIAPFFKLTVVNGSPGENLNNPVQTIKGTDFEVSADLPDADDPNQYFDHWEVTCSEPVTIESLYQPTTTIIMPAADVTLTPVWTSVPPVVPGTPDSGSSSDVETVIVGAVLGGAAVWGGYEIATRIILKNLLPEGASIPADRGQLALLLWQHAGKPEPAAQPAFADVTDTEMAQAAQWCVEQGYLTAKNGAFDPDGWVPKAKTIQVWNRAFGGK